MLNKIKNLLNLTKNNKLSVPVINSMHGVSQKDCLLFEEQRDFLCMMSQQLLNNYENLELGEQFSLNLMTSGTGTKCLKEEFIEYKNGLTVYSVLTTNDYNKPLAICYSEDTHTDENILNSHYYMIPCYTDYNVAVMLKTENKTKVAVFSVSITDEDLSAVLTLTEKQDWFNKSVDLAHNPKEGNIHIFDMVDGLPKYSKKRHTFSLMLFNIFYMYRFKHKHELALHYAILTKKLMNRCSNSLWGVTEATVPVLDSTEFKDNLSEFVVDLGLDGLHVILNNLAMPVRDKFKLQELLSRYFLGTRYQLAVLLNTVIEKENDNELMNLAQLNNVVNIIHDEVDDVYKVQDLQNIKYILSVYKERYNGAVIVIENKTNLTVSELTKKKSTPPTLIAYM